MGHLLQSIWRAIILVAEASLYGANLTHIMNDEIRAIVQKIHDDSAQAVIAVAGAGTQAIAWLLGVAGASRTVLEITVPYSSSAFVNLVGHEPDQFVSLDAAKDMARAAYKRAVHLREGNMPVVGVACTATIATDRPKRGDHRCHVASWGADGVRTYSLTFNKGLRDRDGEDEIASRLVLRSLVDAAGGYVEVPVALDDAERIEAVHTLYQDPVAALMAGHVDVATVYPDGAMSADAPTQGGVLPGSFNPLHQGHEELADAASDILKARVSFELSVANVDKPPLAEDEVRARVAQFKGKRPIILTGVPVFYKKARILPGSTFVIGWDTAVRIVDPRYYDGQKSKLLLALEEMRSLGCSFLVAGRADAKGFHTVAEVDVPADFGKMFQEVPESAFRSDISSTGLRLDGKPPE